jgi:hypothetical protein
MFKNLSMISGETQLMWPVEWIFGDRCVKYRYVKKPQYDIWGDTVNVASRMDSCGQMCKIQVCLKTSVYIQLYIFPLNWSITVHSRYQVLYLSFRLAI